MQCWYCTLFQHLTWRISPILGKRWQTDVRVGVRGKSCSPGLLSDDRRWSDLDTVNIGCHSKSLLTESMTTATLVCSPATSMQKGTVTHWKNTLLGISSFPEWIDEHWYPAQGCTQILWVLSYTIPKILVSGSCWLVTSSLQSCVDKLSILT